MERLSYKISRLVVPSGSVAVFWLGQAGFVFKTSGGLLIAADLYLSDCCMRYFGFKRLMPFLLEPGELELDAVIATHAHYDHFDVDAMPSLLSSPRTRLYAARDCRAECERLSLSGDRITYISCGEEHELSGVKIRAVPCDHGQLAPYAVGLLLSFSDKRIYITGDTSYREDFFDNPLLRNADLLILPINGAFGNLDEEQAARAARQLSPRLALPCHYWNFAEHGGSPALFAREMDTLTPAVPYILMRMGEYILI